MSILSFLPPLSFSFTDTPPTALYTLSLHDALPILPHLPDGCRPLMSKCKCDQPPLPPSLPRMPIASPIFTRAPSFRLGAIVRSEEHTSELQSLRHLVCRLLLEKKKKKTIYTRAII